MTTATDTLFCVFCHEPIGDEPAAAVTQHDGAAHRRCLAALATADPDTI
jgi:hypothetical protein